MGIFDFLTGSGTTKSGTTLPKYVEDASKDYLAQANATADNLAKPYAGDTVAGMNAGQMGAIGAIQGNAGSTNAAFNAAGGYAQNVAGYDPSQVGTQSFLNGDVSQYMNPYIQNVENAALQNMQKGLSQNLNQISDAGIRSGAAFGSRQGVQEGAAAADMANNYATLSANLRNTGYNSATDLIRNDMNMAYNADVANQNAGLQGAAVNLAGANSMGNLAGAGQTSFLQGQNAALAGGNQIQGQAQAELDADKNLYNANAQYPLDQLNILGSALGQTPYSTSSYTTQPGNPLMSTLGAGLLGSQIYNNMGW